MNHRKYKQAENQKRKKMYTPDGYIKDPKDAVCPFCGKKQMPCSYVDSLSRSWARQACALKYKDSKNTH